MLSFRQKIITQIAAFFLVFIIPMTFAAFTGHGPDDAEQCTDCASATPSSCGCCEKAAGCQQQSDDHNAQPQHTCHCFCFTSLQSILPGLDIQNILLQQPFYTLELHINTPQVIHNIFQPPKNGLFFQSF